MGARLVLSAYLERLPEELYIPGVLLFIREEWRHVAMVQVATGPW